MIRMLLRGRRLTRVVAVSMAASAIAALAAAPTVSADDNDITPLPRIAAGDDRRLVDTETGRPFIPRGYNYVRLAPQPWNPTEPYHATFEPGQYDAERAEAALAENSAAGFNTIRVFIDPGHGQDNLNGTPHGLGRGDDDHSVGNAEYLDNLADFVRRAASHGMYVLPSMDAFPQNAYYVDIITGNAAPVNVTGQNVNYLYEGFVQAKEAYLENFTTEMTDRLGPLMSTFLALQLDNEAHVRTDEKPFSAMSGTFTGPDGTAYDMAVPEERQAAADDAIVAYANRATAAVKSVDADLMVTMGAFTNKAVGKSGFDGFSVHCADDCSGDFRYPVRVSALTTSSDLDFFDIHTYPTPDYTLEESLNSVEWPEVEGVVINGEFGALRENYGSDINRAAEAMRTHQVDSCAFGLAGWLFWTWDTDEDEIQRLFFRGSEDDGVIDAQLTPAGRPDPCQHTAPEIVPLAVTSPAEGHTASKPDIEFSGTGHGGGEVVLSVEDEELGTATVADDGTWSVTPDSGVPVGTRFEATLTQVVGLDYQDVTVAGLGVTAPPVTIDTPAEGAALEAGQSIEGTAFAGAELSVTLETEGEGSGADAAAIDGTLDRVEDGSWTFAPAAALAAGEYAITATATAGEEGDPELLASDATVTFTVEESSGGDSGTESGTDSGTETGGDGSEDGADENGAGEAGTESGTDGGSAENGDDDGTTGGGGEELPNTGAGDGALVLVGLGLLVIGGLAWGARSRGVTGTR